MDLSSESKEEVHDKMKTYYADILSIDKSFINILFENVNSENISINIKIFSITKSKSSIAFEINSNISDISVIITKMLFEYCNDINLLKFKNLKIINYGENTVNVGVTENQYLEINIETGCCDI
jgi:hypothetical protein